MDSSVNKDIEGVQKDILAETETASNTAFEDFVSNNFARSSFSRGADNIQVAESVQDNAKSYEQARKEYNQKLDDYWKGVSDARAEAPRRFINIFPPSYDGPPKPKIASSEGALERDKGKDEIKPKSQNPSLKDMLDQSRDLPIIAFGNDHSGNFNILRSDENTFKARYAEEALRVGKKFDLSDVTVKDIVQKIYAIEGGGWSTYDTLSGMTARLVESTIPRTQTAQQAVENFHGPSSALGYNQIIISTTMELLHSGKEQIVSRLQEMAKEDPSRAEKLKYKASLIESLDKSILTDMKKMFPEAKYWDANGQPKEELYRAFSGTDQLTASGKPGRFIGRAVQALLLDAEIGPILQAQQLASLFKQAKRANWQESLVSQASSIRAESSAFDQLKPREKEESLAELLKLVKDSTNITSANDQSSTSINSNKVSEFDLNKQSLAKKISDLQTGVSDGLLREKLTDGEYSILNGKVLPLKRLGEKTGELSQNAKLALSKIYESHYGGISAEKLLPAALHLANLVGPGAANSMLKPENANYPTVNFISRKAYENNGITNGRTSSELLLAINRVINGPNSSKSKPGIAAFDTAFEKAMKKSL